jgi:hypothetical protein
MDSETILMTSIHSQWGELLDSVCKLSSVPPAFLAALIAGESGGKAAAKRFEPHVLAQLWQVLMGRNANFGSIGRDDLLKFVMNANLPTDVEWAPSFGITTEMMLLDSLATSWGLVQIMGYEAIEFHSNGVQALQSPASELPIALKMLAQFAQRNSLDLSMKTMPHPAEFFDCWNTGRPHAQTADPNYIGNGMRRMAIYQGLLITAETQSTQSSDAS